MQLHGNARLCLLFLCVWGVEGGKEVVPLSHGPKLALRSPQSQIKVGLTPGPLTY